MSWRLNRGKKYSNNIFFRYLKTQVNEYKPVFDMMKFAYNMVNKQ